jgi:hypothetical protein
MIALFVFASYLRKTTYSNDVSPLPLESETAETREDHMPVERFETEIEQRNKVLGNPFNPNDQDIISSPENPND